MQKTLRYLISLILFFCVVNSSAQNNKKDSTATVPKKILLNDLRLDIDVAPIVTSLLSNGETYSYEAALQASFLQKYYPIVEIGFAGADKLSLNNIGFKTNGIFGRLGVDFNLLKSKSKSNKPASKNYFLAGLRLGYSTFSYDLTNIVITDNYWNISDIYDFKSLTSSNIWYEIVAGIRVEIVKNIYMGWTMRTKTLIGNNKTGEFSPWYIPGFGINNSSSWGFNYAIGYKF